MKKSKILVAKILIIIILCITLGLGMVILVDFLSKPKTLFYSAIESIEVDLNRISSTLSSNKLYALIDKNSIEVNGTSSLNLTNLQNEANILEAEKINAASYTNIIKYDKSNKYFSNEIIVNQNDEQKFDMIYIDDDFEKSIKDTSDGNVFNQLHSDKINIELIDLNKNIYISDTIKRNFSEALIEDNFTSNTSSIRLNGQTIECNVSIYEMSGTELLSLIDNIILDLNSHKETLNYIADLYGIESSLVSDKLNSMKKGLEINETSTYVFSAYTKTSNDETVKFAITEELEEQSELNQEIISYNISANYTLINFNLPQIKSIEIKNENTNITYTLDTIDSRYILTLDNSKNAGSIDIIKNKTQENLLSVIFNYTFDQTNNNLATVNSTLNFKQPFNDEIANVKIESSLQLNSEVQIEKVSLEEYEANSNVIKYDITTMFNEFLDNLKIYLN